MGPEVGAATAVHQNQHISTSAPLALEDGRGPTGEGTLFAKGGPPGTTEHGVIDVGLVRKTTVCGLAAHDPIPGTVEALQMGLSLEEAENQIYVVKHQGLKNEELSLGLST